MAEKLSVKMNFFIEQGENATNPEGTNSGNDVHCCSEEERKIMWMRETRIRLFMQMKLEACRNEFRLDGKNLRLNTQKLPREGLRTYASTHSFHLRHLFGKKGVKGKKAYITTYFKDGSQNVLSTTSTSVARSSTAS